MTTAVIVVLFLALGCVLLVSCVLALDLMAAERREVREAEEADEHARQQRGME